MTLDPWQVVTGCMTLLVGLLVFIGRLYANRIENHAKLLIDHSDRLTKMESAALTKADLKETAERLERTWEMHLAYIRTAIEQAREDAKEAKQAAKRE